MCLCYLISYTYTYLYLLDIGCVDYKFTNMVYLKICNHKHRVLAIDLKSGGAADDAVHEITYQKILAHINFVYMCP